MYRGERFNFRGETVRCTRLPFKEYKKKEEEKEAPSRLYLCTTSERERASIFIVYQLCNAFAAIEYNPVDRATYGEQHYRERDDSTKREFVMRDTSRSAAKSL